MWLLGPVLTRGVWCEGLHLRSLTGRRRVTGWGTGRCLLRLPQSPPPRPACSLFPGLLFVLLARLPPIVFSLHSLPGFSDEAFLILALTSVRSPPCQFVLASAVARCLCGVALSCYPLSGPSVGSPGPLNKELTPRPFHLQALHPSQSWYTPLGRPTLLCESRLLPFPQHFSCLGYAMACSHVSVLPIF